MANESDNPNRGRLEPTFGGESDQPLSIAPGVSSAVGDRWDRPQSWSINVLRRMEWKRFEILAAAYFRHLGFRAETIDCGPDGGVDATLYEGEDLSPYAILQCKAWNQRIDVKPIRELLGVMTHRGVRRGIFLATSDFTSDAKAFATPNRIESIGGQAFLARIESLSGDVQRRLLALACEGDWTTPTCPSCEVKTVLRTEEDGRRFWGCPSFPRCKITFSRAADQLSLVELPKEDTSETSPELRLHYPFAVDRLIVYLVCSILALALVLAAIHYGLPALTERASRGAQELFRDAAKAQGVIQNRLRQDSSSTYERQKPETLGQQEAVAREAGRKEAAWNQFFRRSPKCVIEENQTTVDCVNEFIRARRDFDSRWRSGQL